MCTHAGRGEGHVAALVQALHDHGEQDLAHKLHDFVGLVRYEPPLLVIRPNRPQPGWRVYSWPTPVPVVTKEAFTVTVGRIGS